MNSIKKDVSKFLDPENSENTIVQRFRRSLTGDLEEPSNTDVEVVLPQLEERKCFTLDNFEYEREFWDSGKVVIISHESFDDPKLNFRSGNHHDVNAAVICFQRLGYNVHSDDVLIDCTTKQVEDKIDEITLKSKEINSLILFYFTHGNDKDELSTMDGVIKGSSIWTKFNTCKNFENKPKMFVFQACKGASYTTADGRFRTNDPIEKAHKTDALIPEPFTAEQVGNDMLIVYSTIQGNVSFREDSGSWFIQELCRNFSSYGRRDDVLSLLTRTTKCICGNYYYHDKNETVDYQKQMPVFVSTLRKKFYLNRNKDRHFQLEMNTKLDAIAARLNNIIDCMQKK